MRLNPVSVDVLCWYLLTSNVGLGVDFVYYWNIMEIFAKWSNELFYTHHSFCHVIQSLPSLSPLSTFVHTHLCVRTYTYVHTCIRMCMSAHVYLFTVTLEALCISIVNLIFLSPGIASVILASVILGVLLFITEWVAMARWCWYFQTNSSF